MKDQQGQINGFDGAFLMPTWDKMIVFTTPRAAIETILYHTTASYMLPPTMATHGSWCRGVPTGANKSSGWETAQSVSSTEDTNALNSNWSAAT